MYAEHKKALSKQAHCEMCTDTQAKVEAYCQQCNKFACKNCTCVHSSTFSTHTFQFFESQLPKCPPQNKCQLHGESLEIFCFDCDKSICGHCIVKDHRDHNVEFHSVIAEKKKKELMINLMPIRKIKDSLAHALERVQIAEHGVQAQGDSVTNTIETSFKELHTILETHKEQLLKEAKKRVREKMENLKGREKIWSIASAEICSFIDDIEEHLSKASNAEIITMHAEISQQAHKVKKNHEIVKFMEPMEKTDMAVEVGCKDKLQQLCQTEANLTHVLSCQVEFNAAEYKKESKFRLFFTTTSTKTKKHNIKPEFQLKSLYTGLCLKTTNKSSNIGEYHITFTPDSRGRHDLYVSANHQPVWGSPFPVFVSTSPVQLCKRPVVVYEGVFHPHSIAVTSVGEIIVAEAGRDIVVWDKDEGSKEIKIVRRLQYSSHKMSGLQDIALDSEDNIFFIDSQSNKIGKSNKNCSQFQIKSVKQDKGPGHVSIAVLGEEVMVIEQHNEGQIMVYDRELNYVRHISSRNTTRLISLCPDSRGHLYIGDISDEKKIHVIEKKIHVINKKGGILCSISYDSGPSLLYVTAHHMYVGDYSSKITAVFTTEGVHLTKFGCYGGVCVDQDGFVYICDYFNNRLCCY